MDPIALENKGTQKRALELVHQVKQEHLWEIQNGLLVLFLTISVLVLMEGSAPWSTLAAWSRTLADRVAHFLVNIHVYWDIVAQVVEAGQNFLPPHPLAAVQPDEIVETVSEVTKAARAYQWEALDQEFGRIS